MFEIAQVCQRLARFRAPHGLRAYSDRMAISPVALAQRADSVDLSPVAPARRVDSVDLLRGVVMILMALDHVRDYFGAAGINPTNPATTTVPLFFTRWITHFCAPTFFLLTGTGAYLSLRRRGAAGLSRFLVTRGLWLLLLDAVVLRCLAWQFNFDFRVTLLIVLWALGWAMITLAVLVRWPPRVAAIFGIVLIVGHNLLDGISPASLGALRPIWLILHQPGLLFAANQHFVIVAYPLIPWVGVTAVGYALGQCFEWDAEQRRVVPLADRPLARRRVRRVARAEHLR